MCNQWRKDSFNQWCVIFCMWFLRSMRLTTIIILSGGRENQWAKLIVPPGHPGGSDFSLIGDCGWRCAWIARHFLARVEQSSGPFAPWLMIFLVHPVTWTGHPRFPRLKDNQVVPMCVIRFLLEGGVVVRAWRAMWVSVAFLVYIIRCVWLRGPCWYIACKWISV